MVFSCTWKEKRKKPKDEQQSASMNRSLEGAISREMALGTREASVVNRLYVCVCVCVCMKGCVCMHAQMSVSVREWRRIQAMPH